MKKVIFLFAMVLVVSFAMAQTGNGNISVVDQNGNSNDAIVKQIGALHESTVGQFGDLNKATVDQAVTHNISVIAQLKGDNNEADVIQKDGISNEADIVQGMRKGYYADYSGTLIPPNVNIAGSDNKGSVEQLGGNNSGNVMQMGNNNKGDVYQKGNLNEGHIYAGWEGSWWSSYKVTGSNNVASVDQIGNDNWAGIWSLGDGNTSYIDQTGNNNMARLSQGYNYNGIIGVPKVYPVHNNVNNAIQNGDDNSVRNFQFGDGNIFKLEQNNDKNTVGGRSWNNPPGGNYRAEYFQQYGDDNRFAGVVKNHANKIRFNQNFNAVQDGDATLDAASIQDGNLNDIGLMQGQDDWALIQQFGDSNDALLWQDGADHSATIIQTGNGNAASTVQMQ